jgi:hypothetical protein
MRNETSRLANALRWNEKKQIRASQSSAQDQEIQSSSLFSAIGRWLKGDSSSFIKPKKKIPEGFIHTFDLLNANYDKALKANQEINKLLSSLGELLACAYHQGQSPSATSITFFTKMILISMQTLYEAKQDFEEYKEICNNMIRETYESITPGQKVWNLGMNGSVEQYIEGDFVLGEYNHLRPIFLKEKFAQKIQQCDRMVEAGQIPKEWPQVSSLPDELLKIHLPPASGIHEVDQLIANFVTQAQKDISEGALDPNGGEASIEVYLQHLDFSGQVESIVTSLHQTSAAAAAINSAASDDSSPKSTNSSSPIEHAPELQVAEDSPLLSLSGGELV